MGKASRNSDSVVLGVAPKDRAHMDLHKMIAELKTERQRLDEAIQALERVSAGTTRRRGRPPRWLKREMQKQSPEHEKSETESFAKKV